MRYNRGHLDETLAVAKRSSAHHDEIRYVYARAGGFAIERSHDPFHQPGYRVWPTGVVERIGWKHCMAGPA